MPQSYTKIDGTNITAGELVVKAQYLFSMKDNTNWYWEQHTLKKAIIFPTLTIIHTLLDLFGIIDVQETPKSVRNMIQEKNLYKDILFF